MALGGTALVGVVAALPRLRGTTLVAPASWAVLACLAVTVVEAALAGTGSTTTPAQAGIYRYLAGVTAFCPLLALLGAKRPQDRA